MQGGSRGTSPRDSTVFKPTNADDEQHQIQIHMRVFFYIWCIMAVGGLIALFFNSSHIVTCCGAALMAYAAYLDTKDKDDE